MVAAASLVSYLLTVTGMTAAIAQPFAELKGSPDRVLAAANVLFLVTGMFIDVFSNILILVPILIGTVTAAGIGPVHFGIVTSVNVDIGNITPPFGVETCSSRAGRSTNLTSPWCVRWRAALALGWQ